MHVFVLNAFFGPSTSYLVLWRQLLALSNKTLFEYLALTCVLKVAVVVIYNTYNILNAFFRSSSMYMAWLIVGYVADVGLCTNDNTRTSRSDSFITLFRIVTSDQHTCNKAFSFKLWNIKLNNNINIYT